MKAIHCRFALAMGACLVGLATLAAQQAQEKSAEKSKTGTAKKEDAKEKKKWQALFDGKSLAGWKIPNFGTQGEIEVEDGRIMLGFGDGCTGVTYTKEFPKWNYEVRCDAMRVDGNDFFCGMTFPVGNDPCSLIVGGWGGTVVGLSSIDGFDAANNETAKGMNFEEKQWYAIRVRVTKEAIQCWIDDKKVVELDLKDRKISIRPEVELSKPFGIASWRTAAALKDIRVRMLEKEEIAGK